MSSDADALIALARANLGLVMMPDWMVANDLTSGSLRAVLTEYTAADPNDRKTLHLAYQVRDREAARVSAFRSFVLDWFSHQQPDA